MSSTKVFKIFLLIFFVRDNWAKNEEPYCYGGGIVSEITCNYATPKYVVTYIQNKTNIRELTCNYCQISNLTKEFLENEYFKNLEAITLNQCGLKLIEPNVFSKLPNLTKINLSKNKLVSIENDALTSSSIKTIDLSNNNIRKIKYFDLEKIPKLLELNLNTNNLTWIDRETFPAHLKELHLVNNQITTIKPFAFSPKSERSNLTVLTLKQNPINTIVKKAFANLEKLQKELDLSEMGIETIESNAFSGLNSLNKLDLSRNNITNISEYAFPYLKMLKTLNLNQNNKLHLPVDIFFDLNSLTELILPKHCYHELQPGVFNGLKSIKVLDLNNYGLKNLNPEVFKGLLSLEILTLRNNSLTHIKKDTFLDLKRLTTLSLDDNPIRTIDTFAFNDLYNVVDFYLPQMVMKKIASHQFFGLRKVSYLNLKNYSIETIEGGAFLGMNSLTKLDLSYNKIKAIYPHAFVITLKELYLQNNFIKQFEYLNVFDELKFLQFLNISSNQLTDFNDKVFMPLKYLNQIDISNNTLTNFYAEESTCLYNTYLNQISLIDNFWNCSRLENILVHLHKLHVKFHPEYPQIHVTNIEGIPCHSNYSTYHLQNLNLNLNVQNEDRYIVCKEYFDKVTTEIIITTNFPPETTVPDDDGEGWIIYYYVDEMSFVSFVIIIVIGVIIGCMASSIFSQSSEGAVYPSVTSVSTTVATIDNTLPTYDQCSEIK